MLLKCGETVEQPAKAIPGTIFSFNFRIGVLSAKSRTKDWRTPQ